MAVGITYINSSQCRAVLESICADSLSRLRYINTCQSCTAIKCSSCNKLYCRRYHYSPEIFTVRKACRADTCYTLSYINRGYLTSYQVPRSICAHLPVYHIACTCNGKLAIFKCPLSVVSAYSRLAHHILRHKNISSRSTYSIYRNSGQ